FLVAVAIPDEDRLFYQEVDVVVTHDVLLSVSKTPPGEHPYDPRPARESCRPDDNAGMMLYRLVDDIAERYLDLVDALDGEIDELELSRDLIGSVRDYLQAKIANDQNEVMKKLTVIASVLLLPTFIVGLYGQNFRHHFPELGWQFGYAYSWGLIIATTLIQLAFFRWRKWL